LEAFASKVPVITSTASSLPEVAGDAAILVDPYRDDEISAAMQAIIFDSSLAQALVARGEVRAREFTWEKCARRTLDVYKKVIDTQP
jgi:alpha-1,3-rhamnosyl/mannosyltransferase